MRGFHIISTEESGASPKVLAEGVVWPTGDCSVMFLEGPWQRQAQHFPTMFGVHAMHVADRARRIELVVPGLCVPGPLLVQPDLPHGPWHLLYAECATDLLPTYVPLPVTETEGFRAAVAFALRTYPWLSAISYAVPTRA